MDNQLLMTGLLHFVAFVAFVVLHEYGHAWAANRLGDDTPRSQGRLTIDPIAHIDLLGTIILPLLVVFLGATTGKMMLFGWGKPVMVNMSNFRNPSRDDILVSAAGPAMNLIIAIVIIAGLRLFSFTGLVTEAIFYSCFELAALSLFLCFFNLLPIPPLDGGHIMRRLVGMSDESYMMLSQFSFLFFILIMRVPQIGMFVSAYTHLVLALIAWIFGWKVNV